MLLIRGRIKFRWQINVQIPGLIIVAIKALIKERLYGLEIQAIIYTIFSVLNVAQMNQSLPHIAYQKWKERYKYYNKVSRLLKINWE